MRLWTLHPQYLDAKGLVALWREGLLARAVLKGATKGYRHHPQLERFRAHASPVTAINTYLRAVAIEAEIRGYSFDRDKIGPGRRGVALSATQGQLAYEWNHLLRKLRVRSPALHARWRRDARPEPHPLFKIVGGGIESWERKQVWAPNKRSRGR
jgi:Pyrimidine dimer DNA glycosylase